MNLSYQWLNQYLPLAQNGIKPAELAEKLARTAVEIDDVFTPGAGLKKLVVGYVESVVDHPDSDHLHVCQVQISADETVQIVCGAPNVAAGKKVIVALPGARIADNQKIRKGKIRGEVSNGMLCALQEIGFSEKVAPKDYDEGIWFMPDDAVVGDEVYPYLGLDDEIIATDVTPNRGDMFSMYGNVNDIAAMYDLPANFTMHELTETGTENTTDLIQVNVADEKLASTYQIRVIKDLQIADSPLWLQRRLWNAGVRPINNVVDVTNYIMLKYGQPLHSFDFDKLTDKQLNVQEITAPTKFTTLDGEERDLLVGDLVIADGQTPVALAGTMGGESTKVDDQTTSVALEAAIFEPIHVRKQSRRLDLHSESSMRFERGINPELVTQALDEAAFWLQELAHGHATKGIAKVGEPQVAPTTITITTTRVNHVLGTALTTAEIVKLFDRLQFKTNVAGDELEVLVPARRWDISLPADLYEEIARIYGYDNIPETLPTTQDTLGGLNPSQTFIRSARRVMEGLGLNQAISYSLLTEQQATQFTLAATDQTPVKLDYPMSSEHTTARMNLISGLLLDVAYNVARKNTDVALYEQGRAFLPVAGQERPNEPEYLAAAITGNLTPATWQSKPVAVDFFSVKGMVEQLLSNLKLTGVKFVANQTRADMHPGRTADIYVADQLVGFIGQVHPLTAKEYKINETYVFQLDLSQLMTLVNDTNYYTPISKYPSVTRDMALLVDKTVTNADILAVINDNAGKFLVDVKLFDVYQGTNLPGGKKSLAYTLTYQDATATLTEDQVNAAFEKVVTALEAAVNAEVR